MKLKLYAVGLSISILIVGYGIFTISSADNNKIYKTIDTIRGYFETNNNGETYGTYIDKGNGEWKEPDLMEVVGLNDVEGYVKKTDLYDKTNQPNNPEEALAYMEKREKEGPRIIPVYKKDGKTVIGEYKID
ncbi:hypothetical protein [Faecalimicrobium sp. JNUCC 81]